MAKKYDRIREWFFTGVPHWRGGRNDDLRQIASVLQEFGSVPSSCLEVMSLLDMGQAQDERRLNSRMTHHACWLADLDRCIALVAHMGEMNDWDGAAIDYAIRSGKDCLLLDDNSGAYSTHYRMAEACSPKNLVFKRYGSRSELECMVRSFATQVVADHPPLPGAYVVLEGGEGCGKSTQKIMLAEYLEGLGFGVVQTREPGGSKYSDLIRSVLLSPFKDSETLSPRAELFLFEAARAQLVESVILPAMRDGKIVLTDRNYFSSCAYQGFGRGLGLETIDLLNAYAMDGLKPDLAVIIDIDPAVGLVKTIKTEFGEKDRFEREELEFHTKVRQGYIELAKREPNVHVIPYIGGDPNLMCKNIRDIVDKHLLPNFKDV